MNNNLKRFLPIGTVVLLMGGKKRLMITGFCTVDVNNKEKIYDYSGCIYPEGVIKSTQTILFNHDQIERVFYLGYSDEEEKKFKEKLNKTMTQKVGDHFAQMAPVQNNQTMSGMVNNVVNNQQNYN